MNMAASLARKREIVINTNLKKSKVHSDWAIVIKKIPMDTPKEMIVTAVAKFGDIKSIKIQLIGMWRKAVVEFTDLSQANLLASRWSFLIRKDSVRMAKAVGNHNIWASKDCFRTILFTLPVETTAHNLGTLLDGAGNKTCIINQFLNTGNRFCCAVIGFESEKNLDSTFCTEPARLDLVWYGKCGCFRHSALECDAPIGSMLLLSLVKSFKSFVSEERHLQLAKLYKKKEVFISHPVAFGEKFWAQMVLAASFLSHGFPAGPSSNLLSSSYHDIGDVSSLNECLASLKCSLELLFDWVSTIVRCLDSTELVSLVSSSFVSSPNASVSLASGLGSDMVLDGTSILSAPSSSTVDVDVHVLSSSSSRIPTGKVGGLESKLASLETSIDLFECSFVFSFQMNNLVWKFAMCNVQGLNVPAKWADIIKDEFEGVQIFTSGLDVGYLSTSVAVIINNSLAHHVSKVEVVSGHVILVHLLFKSKLSVTVLGLYAGASSSIRFGQAFKVNSLIAKAVNTSNFVVLSEDFNENGSGKSVSFRFCLGFGLVNSFASHQLALAPTWCNLRGIKKTIDYILVSESLLFTVAMHWVESVSDFFDTDHSAVMVLVGLGGLLDKFKIKDVDVFKWDKFRDCVLVRLLLVKGIFADVKAGGNLDTMWAILEKEMVESADKIFSRLWFSKFYCFRNKHFSKFFGLGLLIVKILGVVHSGNMLEVVCLIKKWSTLDEDKACAFSNLVRLDEDSGILLKHLFLFCKEYRKSKMFESRLAEEAFVKKAIEKCMESFTFNKKCMIKSILDRPFCKVVLDHLVVDKSLVLVSAETRKQVIPMVMSDLWACQYVLLDYVWNNAFSEVICEISLDELLSVVNDLPDDKAADLSGIPNELWKHSGDMVLSCLLELLNTCVVVDGYCVHDSLDQGEIFFPLFWKIFYDPLLCKVKRHEHLCRYRIDTNFVVKTGRIENSGYALNIASEFFSINDISINNEKMVAIPINQSVKIASLSISGQLISIVKKGEAYRYLDIFLLTEGLFIPSLAKVHSDVHFFVNVVLKKTIMDKQYSYLISVVLQPIVSYRMQFNVLVRKGLRSKACLLHDFPNEALHHPFLYGLKLFDQTLLNLVQFSVKLLISPVNNFLAGVVRIFLDCELSLAGFLPSAFRNPGNFLMFEILGKSLFLSCVCFLKCFGVAFGDKLFDKKGAVMNWKTFCCWKKLNPRGSVSHWFNVTSRFLLNRSSVLPAAVKAGSFSGCSILDSEQFAFVCNGLLKVWSGFFDVYTNGLLKFADSSSVISRATAYFPALDSGVSIGIHGLLSSTLLELQAVALALKCIPLSCAVVLHLNSQAAINAYVSKLAFAVKVKGHSGVSGNDRTDMLAGEAAGSSFSLLARVHECFLVAEGTTISEAGPGHDVVPVASLQSFDWIASTQVWHPNLHMLVGFTSYVYTQRDILSEASVHWIFLTGACNPFSSSVLRTLDLYHSDVSLYSVMCKGFVLKNWCAKAVGIFGDVKSATSVVVDFVRYLVELYQSKV
ncbi:hypothetical protein G9A89_016963 [Geosiphon pyriformis]|nr:hypothetical protein G9A89_016963 [Geosiphon pyriformis]